MCVIASVTEAVRRLYRAALEPSLRSSCLHQSVVIFYKIIYIMFLYINKRNKEGADRKSVV